MATMARIVARHHGDILARWEATASRLEAARGLDRSELLGLLPQLLAQLGRCHDEPDASSAAPQRLVESHVANRLRQGFLLNDILNDFTILSRCIAHAVTAEVQEDRPTPGELAELLHDIHVATAVATAVFNEHMLEDEQLQKRYRRLIAAASRGPLAGAAHADDTTRRRMRAMLELTMTVIGADTVALLLHDEALDRLVMVASAGLAAETLEKFVSTFDASTFAGLVASRPDQATVIDVATSGLELGDALRESGIRTLLGIRLASEGRLRAVLYVGAHEARTFSPSETRKLEALGDIMTPHLENLRLQAEVEALGALVRELATPASSLPVLVRELEALVGSAQASAARLTGVAPDLRAIAGALDAQLGMLGQRLTAMLDGDRALPGTRSTDQRR